ncbi:MAG: alpha/beta hydrolase [Candidatus Bipolaricaulota bacterium]|nr:alpha/beta hydrolase [Candidatus Bipolaricaulota bacterium]
MSYRSAIPTLEGVEARWVATPRLATRVLFSGPEDGEPVLFLHGNLSSATWWEETLVALPRRFRGIAPDLRGFGEADPEAVVDATRGMGDFAEDAIALLNHLRIERAHLVGNSLGGVIVYHLLARYPDRWWTATLVGPGSPYGFGGTKDERGTPWFPDYAGSGGGLFSPKLIGRIAARDRSTEHRFSPRNALRDLVYKRPFVPPREEAMLDALFQVHLGEKALPGDVVRSPNWPYFAPGRWGATNALSPKYLLRPEELWRAEPKVPVLWVRGADDVAISDRAASDPVTFGEMGLIPGWPGPEVCPHQPMLKQTRYALERYQEAGGRYWEVVIPDCGHVAFIERPREFHAVFHAHLRGEL